MDVTMPVLNGLEAARLIRASAGTRDLKAVVYTANPDLVEGGGKEMVRRRASQTRRP